MNPNIVLQQPRLITEIDYLPAVSIILPASTGNYTKESIRA